MLILSLSVTLVLAVPCGVAEQLSSCWSSKCLINWASLINASERFNSEQLNWTEAALGMKEQCQHQTEVDVI